MGSFDAVWADIQDRLKIGTAIQNWSLAGPLRYSD
jgi:hypothetical protein